MCPAAQTQRLDLGLIDMGRRAISALASFMTATTGLTYCTPVASFTNQHCPLRYKTRCPSSMFMSHAISDSRQYTNTGLKRLVLVGGGHAHVQGMILSTCTGTLLQPLTFLTMQSQPKVIKAINARTRPENVHVTLFIVEWCQGVCQTFRLLIKVRYSTNNFVCCSG